MTVATGTLRLLFCPERMETELPLGCSRLAPSLVHVAYMQLFMHAVVFLRLPDRIRDIAI